MNKKRQKRQTEIDFVELTGQNINGSATGPQDIFIEHYVCDAEEITNVKYYELNKNKHKQTQTTRVRSDKD